MAIVPILGLPTTLPQLAVLVQKFSSEPSTRDNHFFVQYLHWAYRATTRKQAHRASNVFSVKTMTQGWHQGWQRKTYCFCHLRNLHLRSQKELVQLFGLWTLRVTSSARTQRWLEAQCHAIPTPFNSPRDPLSTPAPREQHAMQSTPSNIRSHQKSHFHDINIVLPNTFPNRILTHAASHRKHT